jgi:uncharacterized protein with FMN-binding domain
MRRAIFAIAATIAGLVALLTFKTTAVQGPPAAAPAAPVPVAPGSGRGAGTTLGWLRGPAVDTKFGPVQVRVHISGGRITDVQAMRLPADTKLSQRISAYVGPLLQREVLRAQSARIASTRSPGQPTPRRDTGNPCKPLSTRHHGDGRLPAGGRHGNRVLR